MNSKLKPLDLTEENEVYEAYNERKEINFNKCDHKDIKYKDNRLVCNCGAVYTGSRLQELFDLLTGRK